jgi:hypothetical protein
MDYRVNLKHLLMKGKMFKIKGQGIGGDPSLRMSSGSGLRLGGTISHRPLNLDLSGDFERFRISSGKGVSQNAVTGSILGSLERINKAKKSNNKPKKPSKKASSKKKQANFKSLKLNF